jgi:cytochrome d ubiquinol oxidase subunit II
VTLPFVWFALSALALGVYVVLDGFDLGAGILHLFVARSQRERRQVAKSIGPVWDGNEVWLLAGGATIFLAFPKLYAIGVSGFYLPVMILLWLLAFRALGIEMKHYLHDPLWDEAWDLAFAASSLLITLFLGVALGNVVRGVSFDESGHFFAPLWTDFSAGDPVGILDGYTLTVGVTATILVTLHGALWLAHRTEGEVQARAALVAKRLAWVAPVAVVAATVATLAVQPLAKAALGRPLFVVLPVATALCLALTLVLTRRERHRQAFFASIGGLGALLGSAVFAIYPYVLPSRSAVDGLTARAAASTDYGLTVGLAWWIPGVLLATGYTVFVYRSLPRTIPVETEAEAPASSTAHGGAS